MKSVKTNHITTGVFVFVLAFSQIGQAVPEKSDVEKMMASVRVFEYGHSTKPLREIERFINESHNHPELLAHIEKEMIKALETEETTLAAKWFICRKLQIIGTEASVPVLGNMLLHEGTTEMACYALCTQPSRSADRCLRRALGKIKGGPLIAVVTLLGDRHDSEAVRKLVSLIEDDDPAVAEAAIAALGKIGGPESIRALAKHRRSNGEEHTFLLAEAYLHCAHNLALEGKPKEAAALYRELTGPDEPDLIRRGALHGLLDVGELDIDFEKITPVKILDGKTLAGWEGNLEFFRVEDGSIVAGTLDQKIPRNEFLCTIQEYQDFELRVKCRLHAGQGNAGIQIRSDRIPNSHEMIGYQADMGENYWGNLYDESRRKRTLAVVDNDKLAKVLNPDGWNDYVIRCTGRRIQLWINGYQTVDYLEPENTIKKTGRIGLQIHSGQPSEAWYKDLSIRVFDLAGWLKATR